MQKLLALHNKYLLISHLYLKGSSTELMWTLNTNPYQNVTSTLQFALQIFLSIMQIISGYIAFLDISLRTHTY